MDLLLWAFVLLILTAVNYGASRTLSLAAGALALLITSLPAIALVGFAGFQLAYAVVNADEVNRRFQEGDLTYFGADQAFMISLVFAGVWAFSGYTGFRLGRRHRSRP
ncbi:hypothetical protein [Sphingosinicella terrae]|uniref:hypothetical protein n=1 Tax=Sphingosinicella terrae TaxID=2172047 RepID=UPI000E0DD45A|nr:hypothetical protein [Sphingosinicella terrae]